MDQVLAAAAVVVVVTLAVAAADIQAAAAAVIRAAAAPAIRAVSASAVVAAADGSRHPAVVELLMPVGKEVPAPVVLTRDGNKPHRSRRRLLHGQAVPLAVMLVIIIRDRNVPKE